MPIYEYKCNECSHLFEELRKMKDMDKEVSCPQCGLTNVKRQLSTFGVKGNNTPDFCDKSSCGGG